MPAEPEANAPLEETEDDVEMEIVVEVTDDQQVALTAGDWGVVLKCRGGPVAR